MGKKSKFFRAFVAGATISDGRVVTPEMINEIVDTFNAETYTPRCNVEHVAGYSPEPPFNGYGSVTAVKAQTDSIVIDGKAEQRVALYCQVDANDQLVALAAKDQKPFPSVELTADYAGTGKVGLVGLAFTDRPASIATQALNFSRHAPGTVFGTAPEATALEFDATAPTEAGLTEMIKGAFSTALASFRPEPKQEEPKPPANDNAFDPAAFATAIGDALVPAITAAVKPANDAITAMDARFTALEAKLSQSEAPGTFSRQPATGGGGNKDHLTDC